LLPDTLPLIENTVGLGDVLGAMAPFPPHALTATKATIAARRVIEAPPFKEACSVYRLAHLMAHTPTTHRGYRQEA